MILCSYCDIVYQVPYCPLCEANDEVNKLEATIDAQENEIAELRMEKIEREKNV